MANRKGHFIVIEGTDGSGKATQTKFLRKKLQILNIPHEVIEFPRYTGNPYGRLIGRYLKGEFGDLPSEVGTYLISLAYAGDRFLARDQIRRWLKEGKLVIADRYVPSNKAHMSAKLPMEHRQDFIDWLDDLEYNINEIPREELVVFLYAPSKVSQKNIGTGKKGSREYLGDKKQDIHESNLEHLEEAAKMYLRLFEQEPNWVKIECVQDNQMRSREEIHEEILQLLKGQEIIR